MQRRIVRPVTGQVLCRKRLGKIIRPFIERLCWLSAIPLQLRSHSHINGSNFNVSNLITGTITRLTDFFQNGSRQHLEF